MLLLLAGCASAPPVSVISGTNLALGPSADHNRLGEWFAGRSDWPVANYGYQFVDISESTIIGYDDQSFYETGAGSFYRSAHTYRRTGWLR